MIRSDTLSELNTALCNAQGEFEAVSKTASNPFFKSKFAPLPEVVRAATPILAAHGLAVWQGGHTDDHGELLYTVVLHSSGEYIGSAARMLPVPAKQYDKDGNALAPSAQDQGSAITYQRRYQYMAALGLVADEDDDGGRASARSKPVPRKETRGKPTIPAASTEAVSGADNGSDAALVSEETLKEISAAYKQSGVSAAAFKAILKEVGLPEGKKSDELTEDQGTWVAIKLTELTKATDAG